jgi:hypothetical protein
MNTDELLAAAEVCDYEGLAKCKRFYDGLARISIDQRHKLAAKALDNETKKRKHQ